MRWLVMAILLCVATSVLAEDVSERDRFQLWYGCSPVRLAVENLSNDAGKIGLRKENIETAVRSRLRSARIYDDNAFPILYINANVTGRAFSITIEFIRRVEVLLPDWEEQGGIRSLVDYASVWVTGSTGTHGRDSNFILSSATRHADEFIDEYLRVNADACQ